MKRWRVRSRNRWEAWPVAMKLIAVSLKACAAACIPGMVMVETASAQADGNTGISQATTMVSSYFDTGVNLMYAVGGILGLIGAVRVYQKWSHGDHDTSKVAAAWFGSCIFLVVVATLIKAFFGLQ